MSRRSLVTFFVVVGTFFGVCLFLLIFGLAYSVRSGRLSSSAKGIPSTLRGKPLPVKTSKHTGVEFRKALLVYNRRTALDAYRKVGMQSPKWDATAERVLEGYCLTVSEMPEAPSPAILTAQVKTVLDLGCTDPLLQYIYARQLHNQNRLQEAIPWFERATAGFARSKYPTGRTFNAPLRLVMCYRAQQPQDSATTAKIQKASEQAIQWAAASLHDGSFLPGEERIQMRLIIAQFDFFDAYDVQWHKQLQATPDVDPCVMNVLEGYRSIQLAWRARGDGFASTVTEQGQKGFYDNLHQARTALEAAWKLHRDWPEAPAMMIVVAKGDSSAGSPRAWFDRSVAAQFDYLDAYTSYIPVLFPRWGGSHEAMYAFGKECLDTGRFDTEVPVQYYYLLYAIENDRRQFIDRYGGLVKEYWQRPEVYANLLTMCEGYETKGEPQVRDDYHTLHAILAWEHKDYDAAKKVFDALGNHARPIRYLAGLYPGLAQVREEVYTRAAPAGPLFAEADRLHREKGPAAARDEYRRLLARKWDPATKGYLQQRLADTERELQFSSGQWINLLPAADLRAWDPVIGEWSLKDGALIGISQFGLRIFLRGEYGPRLEMVGVVEFLDVQKPEDPAFNPPPNPRSDYPTGFYAGASGNVYQRQDAMQGDEPKNFTLDGTYLAYFVDPLIKEARTQDSFYSGRASKCMMPVQRRNTLRLLLWDDEMTTYLNGRLVHRAIRITPQAPAAKSTIGLGANVEFAPDLTVRFNHLRLRRLTTRPIPAGLGLAPQPELNKETPAVVHHEPYPYNPDVR